MNLLKSIAAIAAAACLQSCTAIKTVVHNFADLDDHVIFSNRVVEAAAQPAPLRTLTRVPGFMAELKVPDVAGRQQSLDAYLDSTRTAAFVVLRDDTVVYERYARGFDAQSKLNSFSIAKSVMSALVGIAMAEGKLPDLDAAVSDYRPDFAATAYGPVKLRHLIEMTSGVDDAPSLLPGRSQYYYSDDLRAVVAGGVAAAPPGERWRYSEADVQMLGFVLQSAVGKTLSAYLAEKLWQPLGMESEALWALDRGGGEEKAFCCISARARDFARFGQLFRDGGRVGNRQLVPPEWARPAALAGVRTPDHYTHRQLWWFPEGDEGDYYAYGHNGQFLYVNPAAHVVIVKFSESSQQDPMPMFRAVTEALRPEWRAAELDRLAAPRIARR